MNMVMEDICYSKTTQGLEEIQLRKNKLSPKLRTMLLLIDGSKDSDLLVEHAMKIGAPDDFLETLEAHGYIYRNGNEDNMPSTMLPSSTPQRRQMDRFGALRDFMSDSIMDAYGASLFAFMKKLSGAQRMEDLNVIYADYQKLINKRMKTEAAAIMLGKAQEYFDAQTGCPDSKFP